MKQEKLNTNSQELCTRKQESQCEWDKLGLFFSILTKFSLWISENGNKGTIVNDYY